LYRLDVQSANLKVNVDAAAPFGLCTGLLMNQRGLQFELCCEF
jgi:hypothetical protein